MASWRTVQQQVLQWRPTCFWRGAPPAALMHVRPQNRITSSSNSSTMMMRRMQQQLLAENMWSGLRSCSLHNTSDHMVSLVVPRTPSAPTAASVWDMNAVVQALHSVAAAVAVLKTPQGLKLQPQLFLGSQQQMCRPQQPWTQLASWQTWQQQQGCCPVHR
jgi:hypothetical protein